ncbi:CALS7 [Symbiodinium sp. CCMP2592]|nr:CALS7 [Symbiodinium sp. CCMP2592]
MRVRLRTACVLCLLQLLRCEILLDRPDSQYKGNSSNCTKLFVNSPPFDSGTTVHGINSGIHPRTTGSKADMLTIRAIYYEPRPVGLSPGLNNDLYTSTFNNIHERDLYIMRNILHANAVRLAPWDSEQDHSGFLRACKKYGMYVIPTFDLSYFLSTAARMSAFSQRQSEVWKGFQKFLHQALQDAADIEELILMWTVNFGLNLNETTEQGPRSISLLSEIRDEYFQLLRVIRSAQWLQECGPGKASACDGDRFKRPLGVPLLLDTILRQDNIGWYLGFSETVWGTWPVDELSLHIDEKTFNRLRPRGAFDAWIVQSQPPTNRQGQTDLAQQLKWFNATMAESHNAFAWHDLATQTLRNPAGDLLEGCDPGIGCTYPTQKLVIAQFGFAAEAPMYGSVNELVDPVLQQQLMGELYKGLSSLESCAEAGVTIDEWVDDWGRSEVLGCPGSVFQHPHTGPCDEVRPGRTIHHEWFGMNGQYTFLSFHCLDPRYHQEHPTRSSGEKVGGSAFRFDDIPDAASENQLWNLLPGGYCAVMHERLWLLALNFALFFCGAALEVFYWCKCCCFRKLVKPPRHRHPAHARAADSQVLLEAESPSRTDAIELGRFEEPPADMQDANNVVKAETPLLLPDEMSKGAAEVMICMTASVVREGKVQFTTDTLRFFAEAHVKTQCRRLKLQVEAEGHALDAEFTGPGRLSREECIGKAMTNIHARVLEGYFVWLEAQRDLRNKEQRLKAMLGTEPSRPRPAWMLFTEAAALRVMESLSEHALHSPEFISMMFHSMRWAESLSDDNAFLPDSVRFTVDYDALHYGVDAMRKNTNPFMGGVNFDDINDLGEARAEVDVNTVQKTFLESTSWRVLYDLLDNFGPVFTVKLWIFFLAFYVHLGSLPDQNDSFFSPRGSRSDAVQIMALLDATLLVLAELGLLWHGLAQRRLCRSPGRFSSQVKRTHRRWARRRLLSVMLGCGSLGAMVVVGKVGRNLCNLTPEESFEKEKDCSDEFAVLCLRRTLSVHRAISLRLLNSGCAYAVIRLLVFFVFSRRRNIPFVHGTPADLKDKKANQPTVPDAQADQDSPSYVVLFRLTFNGEVPQCIEHLEQQDDFLAEWLLDAFENGQQRALAELWLGLEDQIRSLAVSIDSLAAEVQRQGRLLDRVLAFIDLEGLDFERVELPSAEDRASDPVGTLSVGEESARKTVAAVFVTEHDGKIVTALPHKVVAASPDDRAQPAEFSLKIWVGLLSSGVADSATFDGPGNATDIRFMNPEFGPCFPFAEALVQVSDSQFGFATAPSAPDVHEARFAAIEASLAAISSSLTRVLGDGPGPSAAAKAPTSKVRAKPPPSLGAVPGTPPPRGLAADVPGVDPAVLRAARESGIGARELGEIQGLLSRQKRGLSDFPKQGDRDPDARGGALTPAPSSLDVQEAELEAPAPTSPIEAAVVSLTKIVGELAKSRKALDANSTALERALDRAEGFGASAEPGALGSGGRSKGAAYRLLRETLLSDPAQIYTSIENNLEEDLLNRRLGGALQDSRATSRAWLEHRSHLGNYPNTVRLAWSVCGVWDALRAGRYEEARSRCALCIACCDQQAFDNGSWTLAEQFALEAPPPLSSFAAKRQSALDNTDTYHSRLVEPRWAEVCLHRVRELELRLESKRKLAGKGRQGNPDSTQDGRPDRADKGGPKGGKVAALLTPSVSNSAGPFGDSFFRATLDEIRPAGNRRALELVASVLDSLAAEPMHRVTRGPGASFKSRRWREPFVSSVHRAWDRLAAAVALWDAAPPVDASSMGRTASKVERVEEQVRALAVIGPDPAPSLAADLNLAEDIEVDRLSLPTAPPLFDPSPLLDDSMRSIYLSPSAHAWSIDEAAQPPPRVQFRSSRSAHSACGLFAIPKGLESDRLIVDARPSNLCVPTDVRWLATMGSAAALLRIELDCDQQLYLSGDDIKDFYHQFSVSRDRAAHYRLVGSFAPGEVSPLACFEPSLWRTGRVVAALRCMAMGDCNAVSVAQAAHVGLILESGAVGWHQLLTHRGPILRSPTMLGLVIDDVIVIEKGLRFPNFAPAASNSHRITRALHSAYARVALLRHEKKAFALESSVFFWGADVLGDVGVVRPAWTRLIPLVGLTAAVLELPVVTVSLLETLAGSWVAVLSFRRRCLCLLEQIYLLQRGLRSCDIVRSTAALRAELFRLCVLAPFFRTDLRAQTSGLVVATDASDLLGACVVTSASKALVRELLRHVPVKGLWSKLLSPSAALLRQHCQLDPEAELPGEGFRTSPLWTLVVRALRFRPFSVFKRHARDHINVKELDSYLAAEEALSPFAWESARSLGLVDSQVTLGGLLKGRSSSFSLNSRLRSALPGLLFFNLHPHYSYVASEDNPSDDPTRCRPVRQPSIPEPFWLREAELGNFEPLDRFLCEIERHPFQVQGLDELKASFENRCGSPGLVGPSEPPPEPSAVPSPAPAPGFSALPGSAVGFLLSLPRRQFLWPAGQCLPVASRFSSPGYLCLYAGSRAVAKAALEAGFPWALTFDWRHGSGQDLLDPALQAKLLDAISSGAFSAVGLSPSCPTLSVSACPAYRSLDFPEGLPGLSPSHLARVLQGNSHVDFVVRVVRLVLELRVPFWIDNPDRSWLWKQPSLRSVLSEHSGWGFWVYDHCAYGFAWKKRTRVLNNTALAGTSFLCRGGHEHRVLRGRAPGSAFDWTQLAETPPRRACLGLAMALADAAAASLRTVSSCVRDSSKRLGEADNPGPARPRPRRPGSLFDVDLVDRQTQVLRTRVWDAFVGWLKELLSEGTILSLFSCPPLLALVLRDYADELYQVGAPLGTYRQLLAYSQRRLPLLRPHLKPAWEMATRWEELQPVLHRTPMPEVVLKAMVGIALALKWSRWASVTMAIFYAINRPGELLKAKRRHVLTPTDLLDPNHGWMYFRIKKPKSRRRAARIQHSKLSDPAALRFLTAFFETVGRGELLYPGSAGVYRRRWDRILSILGISPQLKLTPASLRAGGAIAAFQHGCSVQDLLWRMRLRSLATLEFYLQEMSAFSILPKLNERTRKRILAAAAIYDGTVATFPGP